MNDLEKYQATEIKNSLTQKTYTLGHFRRNGNEVVISDITVPHNTVNCKIAQYWNSKISYQYPHEEYPPIDNLSGAEYFLKNSRQLNADSEYWKSVANHSARLSFE